MRITETFLLLRGEGEPAESAGEDEVKKRPHLNPLLSGEGILFYPFTLTP